MSITSVRQLARNFGGQSDQMFRFCCRQRVGSGAAAGRQRGGNG